MTCFDQTKRTVFSTDKCHLLRIKKNAHDFLLIDQKLSCDHVNIFLLSRDLSHITGVQIVELFCSLVTG